MINKKMTKCFINLKGTNCTFKIGVLYTLYGLLTLLSPYVAACAGNDNSNNNNVLGLAFYATVSVGFLLAKLAINYYYPDVSPSVPTSSSSEDNFIKLDDVLVQRIIEVPLYFSDTLIITSLGFSDSIGIMLGIPPFQVLSFLIYCCIFTLAPYLSERYLGIHLEIHPEDLVGLVELIIQIGGLS